jgi:hypothetical protein
VPQREGGVKGRMQRQTRLRGLMGGLTTVRQQAGGLQLHTIRRQTALRSHAPKADSRAIPMKTPTIIGRVLKVGLALIGLIAAQTATAQSAVALDHMHAGVRAVMALQAEVTPGLMASDAVLGTAVGLDDADKPGLVVYVDRNHGGASAAIQSLPPQLRGIAVKVEVTEKFRALAGAGKPGGSGVSHKTSQPIPIKLGTSGGWKDDLANGYCCGGTLGALISFKGVQYVLSNYHVLEADIVPGGNGIASLTGDPIIHPALIDVGCVKNNTKVIGSLVKISSLPGSNVDCSIAKVAVVDEKPQVSAEILEIGYLSSSTVTAALNQAVKKSGRTTGLTRSKVSGLNATINVAYENECAGGSAFTKTFTGQIVLANRGSSFLNGGDSGSAMVEDVTTNPRAIGLLYAGSSTSAIANPIQEVLKFVAGALGGTSTETATMVTRP